MSTFHHSHGVKWPGRALALAWILTLGFERGQELSRRSVPMGSSGRLAIAIPRTLSLPAIPLASSDRRGKPGGSRSLRQLPAGAEAALPLVFGEKDLAQADHLGSHFHVLIVFDVLERLLERHQARRTQEN